MTNFSVKDIREFQKCMKRITQIEKWSLEIDAKIAVLKNQKQHAEKEKAELQEKVKTEFFELEQVKDLFAISEIPDSALSPEESKYIDSEKKSGMFRKVIDSILSESETPKVIISFREMKQKLEEIYDFETKNLPQFFRKELADFEKIGGVRNRKIVIPAKMLGITKSEHKNLLKDQI